MSPVGRADPFTRKNVVISSYGRFQPGRLRLKFEKQKQMGARTWFKNRDLGNLSYDSEIFTNLGFSGVLTQSGQPGSFI